MNKNKDKLDNLNIAIAAEIAPAKTIIPIIEKLKDLEANNELNWKKSKITALIHGEGTEELLKSHCDELHYIGKGRGGGKSKKNNLHLAYLIFKDILKAIKALMFKNINLLITCGNAGDVRKSIAAAYLLNIPIIHIEQDIYNPIELIALANLITVPSKKYEKYLKSKYHLKNVKNIEGYPMATYVVDKLKNDDLLTKNQIYKNYNIDEDNFDNYILFVLGGDLKDNDLKKLIIAIEKIDLPSIIVPYRFDKDYLDYLIQNNINLNENSENLSKIIVLDGFVDLLSLMKFSKAVVYGAGIGLTIELGVLKIPALKIAGFHRIHGSVDLANALEIPIVEIEDIPNKINQINKPKNDIFQNSQLSIDNVIDLINNFDYNSKKSGFNSMKAIWKERSKFK